MAANEAWRDKSSVASRVFSAQKSGEEECTQPTGRGRKSFPITPEKEKKKGTSSLVWQRHLFPFSLTIETTVLYKIITCCCTWPACRRSPQPARALSMSKSGRGRQRIPSATWQIKKGNSAHIWETLYDEKKSYFAERHHRRRRFPLAARSQHCIGGDVRYQCQAVVVLLGRPIGISFSSFAPGRQFCKKKKETSKQK